jgi:hypothetical protein
MPDDKSKAGSDHRRIAANEPYEVGYFARKHGLSREDAEKIIRQAGGHRQEARDARASK